MSQLQDGGLGDPGLHCGRAQHRQQVQQFITQHLRQVGPEPASGSCDVTRPNAEASGGSMKLNVAIMLTTGPHYMRRGENH